MKKTLLVTMIVLVAIATYAFLGSSSAEFIPDISTSPVTRGDVVDTVGATGTLEAVTTVNVGSQVSGMIQDLLVDFNSIVRQGDVIMRLDPSLFETQLEQARANLARAEADVERHRVSVEDTVTQLKRAENLGARDLISDTELEAAQVAVRSAEAQQKSAEAQVTQARASLNQNEVNLEHTVIRAPIDGIVISRLVDAGQTVAASLQAPELFVIAADLTKMRVIANIDESDVGRIRPDQRVTFTVDAYPSEGFEGSVSQIRLEPVVQQNVVTYATVIDAPNPDLKLKPGMTATISLEIARRGNVIRIPNSALRFRPTPDTFLALDQPVPVNFRQRPGEQAPDAASGATSTWGGNGQVRPPDSRQNGLRAEVDNTSPPGRQQMMERVQQMNPEERRRWLANMRARRQGETPTPGRRPQRTPQDTESTPEPIVPAVERGAATIDALFAPLVPPESTGRVWVMQGQRLLPIDVRLGVTDGTASELLNTITSSISDITQSIPEGEQLVTNISTPDASTESSFGGGSPLIPQFPFGRRSRR